MKAQFRKLDDVLDADYGARHNEPAPRKAEPEHPELSPADVHFRLGKQLLAEGQFAQAETELIAALQAGTSFPNQAQFLLRSALVAQMPREALRMVEVNRQVQN